MASGRLGGGDIAANTDTLLYTVPVDTVATVNIRIANRNNNPVAVRVAIGSGASPTAGDYIDYDVLIPANWILEDTGFVCSAGEKVWVRSDTANVSARIHGFEE